MTDPRHAAQAANGVAVTYVLTRLQAQLEKLGVADPMRGLLSYGSLKVTTENPVTFVPLSAWALMPIADGLKRAVADIRSHDAPLVLCFANTSWRLLIACRVISMPDFGDGKSFGSLRASDTLAMLARLHAQPFGTPEPNPTPLRAWHCVVRMSEENAITTFLSTALAHSMPITTLPPSGAFNDLRVCEDEFVDAEPEEDPE